MPGENFNGKIWVVNDFIKEVPGCKAEIRILDNNKTEVKKETLHIGDVNKDSSKEFGELEFKVPGKMGDKFFVELKMTDKTGDVISKNDYMFLVDDQEKALGTYQKYGEKFRERFEIYGKSTNRYFPGLFDNTKSTKVEWINVDEVKLNDENRKEKKELGIVED